MGDINLHPEDKLKNKSGSKIKIVIFFIILIVLMVGLYFAVYIMDYNNRKELISVNEELQSLNEVVIDKEEVNTAREELATKKEMLANINSENLYVLIQEIEKLVPKGIVFTEQYINDSYMIIKGEANVDEEIAELVSNLYNLDNSKEIRIESVNFEEVIKFEVSFQYKESEGGDDNETE
ncbi:MAG: hypothetical protein ACOWWH_06785 [Eubacteriaceae bacterium]